MNEGRTVFAQLMDHVPHHLFARCVARYQGDHRVRSFSCWDQFLCLAFAQLTWRESLRDIELCLRTAGRKLYHLGIRGHVARNTLAKANENRDWRIYQELAHELIRIARPLYLHDDFGVTLDHTAYALDATTIDLCLTLFPWAEFRRTKAAIKLHTLLDLRGSIPSWVVITPAIVHEVRLLDAVMPEPGAFYVLDRGYLDFGRLFRIDAARAFFVIRAKRNLSFHRVYSHRVDHATGVRCDQTITLPGQPDAYPNQLRRIRVVVPHTRTVLTFLTNNFQLPALTIAQLYRARWRVELFFKWIKQHLRIKKFFGTSPNAVKTQIWVAISVYVLVAIIKKRLHLDHSLYTILQFLSVHLFEKVTLREALTNYTYNDNQYTSSKQLKLFDF